MSNKSNKTTRFLGYSYAAIMLTSIGFGLAIIAYQAYFWLRYGHWKPIPNEMAFQYFNVNLTFIEGPKMWLGLAKIIKFFLALPLSLTVPVITILMLNYLQKRIDEELKTYSKQ